MQRWLLFLKQGMSRELPKDRISNEKAYSKMRSNLKNLHPFLKRHWRKAILGAIIVLLTSLLGFPAPLITRYLIDKVILGRQLHLLLGVVLLLAGIKVLAMLSGTWQQFFFTRLEQEVLLDIQRDLVDRTLRFPKSFFDSEEVGYLMSRLLSDVQGLRWFFSSTLVYILSSLLRFAGGLVFLFYLKWQLAGAVMLVLPLLIVAVRFFSRKMRILSLHGMEQQAVVSRTLQESLTSASLIKAFSAEERTGKRMVSELKAALQIGMEQATVGSAANLAVTLAPEIASFIVLVGGVILVVQHQWTLGSMLAFQGYLTYVFGPAQFLATANFQFQQALASLERVSALFDIVPEEKGGSGICPDHLRGEIEFKNVSFGYGSGEMVLEELSLHVRPGEHIAIVGPSGVGKTTLVSLILLFYKPARGEIRFDDRPAGQYQLGLLRERIGYVSQHPELLSGTIMENLRFGNLQATEEEIVRIAKAAGIHDFIASLADGYRSEVGERGVNFSAGQIQRLALARALLKDPDILILDEPTSALDSVTERSIFDALPPLVRGKTMFVVAHRLATAVQSERILLLNEKRLVAVGTHRELLEQNAYYRSLAANQSFTARKPENGG
jgi:ABC-type bacteriocin/lantibiotic exporter with double-glycine peptidase domain